MLELLHLLQREATLRDRVFLYRLRCLWLNVHAIKLAQADFIHLAFQLLFDDLGVLPLLPLVDLLLDLILELHALEIRSQLRWRYSCHIDNCVLLSFFHVRPLS